MGKRIFILSILLSLCFSMNVFASPKTMPNGLIFDAEYYAKTNPDVCKILGTDETVLFNHYMTNGNAEGRLAFEGDVGQKIPEIVATGIGPLQLQCITNVVNGEIIQYPANVKYPDLFGADNMLYPAWLSGVWSNGTVTLQMRCYGIIENYDYPSMVNGLYSFCDQILAYQDVVYGRLYLFNNNRIALFVSNEKYTMLEGYFAEKNTEEWFKGSNNNWIYF